jgi:dihydrofolate reductase
MISTIVATAKNGVIGKEGGLPWYLPAELAHFKKITMGHPIIMGRKTHESIGRPLPGRTNVVVTRDKKYRSEGITVSHSLEDAVKTAKQSPGADEIFIIGGEEIYKQAMPLLNKIYLTEVDAKVEGDKFFNYDKEQWREVSRVKHSADDENQHAYNFLVLERA